MVEIPFPTSSFPGANAQESGGRIINAYAEPLGDGAPSRIARRRSPGLKNFGTSMRTGPRGLIEVAGVLYAAFDGKLEKCGSGGGAFENIGNLNGTKKGFFARNNNVNPDKVFVDPDGNVAVFTPTSVTNSYPDGDLPAVNSVTELDGYLVFTTGDGRAFATDLNSTDVNALSFGKAESKPDGLVRGIRWSDRLLLMGNFTTEIWTNVGTSPFPFARSIVLPRGLIGPYAVTGFEDNFSKGVHWVGDDCAMYRLNGNTPEKISPPDLDGLIEAVGNKEALEMCCYISRGHAFVQLSSDEWTWVFNTNNERWHERKSYQSERSRITQTLYAFGKWLCGDTETGNIQEISGRTYDEVGSPLRVRIESGPVVKFPAGQPVGRADFYFVTGVGIAGGHDPDQTDPTVGISWSDDGGLTWSNPLLRKLGRQSETLQLVSLVGCTGRSGWHGRRWRVDISDAVYVSLLYATQSEDPRAK